MVRHLRTNLPLVLDQLKPHWPYLKTFYMQDCAFKRRQKCDFDRNHEVRPLPLLTEGSDVWVTMKDGIQVPGVVTEHADTPRSYMVNTEEGELEQFSVLLIGFDWPCRPKHRKKL